MKEELLQRIRKEIKEALDQFGTYSYVDKGPSEVMGMDELVKKLNSLTVDDCKYVLTTLCDGTQYEETFVHYALAEMQDVPDDRWEALMKDAKLSDAFG